MVDKELAPARTTGRRPGRDRLRRSGGRAGSLPQRRPDERRRGRQVIDEIAGRHGRIDVLLHAAGLDISHALPDKEPREFDLVFDVKSDGWFNLVKAIGDMPLGATVAFSSVAGRFGNAWSDRLRAANDLLCKLASSFRTTPPGHSCHRDRLDGLGRNRHGHPRLDSQDDGAGRHRDAAARGRRARRSAVS